MEFNRKRRVVVPRKPKWVQKEALRYEITESSTSVRGRPGKRLWLRLQHDVQGNINAFVVYDSNNGLFNACSKDHLDGVMSNWDEALLCLDGGLMKSQLGHAVRYPEVYVLMCIDLFSKTAVGQSKSARC